MSKVTIHLGDCVTTMNSFDSETVDHIITDPPYEIGFMGKGWDNSGVAYNPDTWRSAHRILKPDGLMLVFGATRTHHRIAHAVERAGFEILDIWAWCYATGFPKSQNISKALKKKGYADEAQLWQGYGTALKPAWEPIIVARKQGSDITVPKNQFFYISKASQKEKNAGLESIQAKPIAWSNQAKAELKRGNDDFKHKNDGTKHNKVEYRKNTHPTVKPIELMDCLLKAVSKNESDIILDPFMGSGTTGISCVKHNRSFIGCELTAEYIPLAESRIAYYLGEEE